MAVAHLAASGSADSASVASFTWNHAGGASARAAIVFVMSYAVSTAKDTGVTYGGVSMSLVGSGIDSDTEPGVVRCWFLDNVATGNQDIIVTRTNDATVVRAHAASVSALGVCEAYAAGRVTKGGATTNTGSDTSATGTQASGEAGVDDGSPGTNSLRYGMWYTGAATPLSAGTSSTALGNNDQTAFGVTFVRETTAGQGSRNIGVATGTTDDVAAVLIAIREAPAAAPEDPMPYTGGGYYG